MRAASSDRRRAAWLAALLLAGAALASLASELRVIPLQHRMPDEVVPVLRPLLGPGESVTGVDTKLIVRASPATLDQIERVLREIDVARRNLRIAVRHARSGDAAEERAGVSATVRNGNTRIVVGGGQDTGGLRAGTARPGAAVEAQIERRYTTASDTLTETLTVLDGGHAFLRVGQSLPDVQPFLVLAGDRLGVVAGVQYRDVTTGFDVRPQLQGETVRLAIAPRLAFASNGGQQVVDYAELGTVVAVRLGEWVDLGGTLGSANEINRRILAIRSGRHDDETRFLIRVDLQ